MLSAVWRRFRSVAAHGRRRLAGKIRQAGASYAGWLRSLRRMVGSGIVQLSG